jgi:hypothetical protein
VEGLNLVEGSDGGEVGGFLFNEAVLFLNLEKIHRTLARATLNRGHALPQTIVLILDCFLEKRENQAMKLCKQELFDSRAAKRKDFLRAVVADVVLVEENFDNIFYLVFNFLHGLLRFLCFRRLGVFLLHIRDELGHRLS